MSRWPPTAAPLAAVESTEASDTAAPDGHGTVVVRTAAGAVVRRLDPCPACTYGAPAWSPDGASLAFVATDPAAGTATLTVATGAATRTVATVHGVAQTPRWSPDGRSIAILAVDGATKATGAVEAGAPQVGEIGTSPDEQRIAVVPAAGGALRLVSPADTYVYEYDWLPQGRRLHRHRREGQRRQQLVGRQARRGRPRRGAYASLPPRSSRSTCRGCRPTAGRSRSSAA